MRVRIAAQLDEQTCPACRALDGKTVNAQDMGAIIPIHGICENEGGCRCICIPALKADA